MAALAMSLAGPAGAAATDTIPDTYFEAGSAIDDAASAQRLFDREYEARQYDEAIDAAKLVIEELLQKPEPSRNDVGEALTQLADVQRLSGALEASIENYRAAIESLTAEHGRLNTALIEPMWGLARTYAEAEDFESATRAYEDAMHVFHVNYGPHDLEQAGLLTELSEVHFRAGDFAAADRAQKAYVSLLYRLYAGEDLRQLPAMYSRADMLERIGEKIEAHEQYRRIIDVVERAEGRRSLELLPALYRLSDLLLFNAIVDGYDGPHHAERHVRRAVRIADKHPDATPVQKADAHIALGDVMMLRAADRSRVLRQYRTAWNLLSGDEDLVAERDKRFGDAVPLNDRPGFIVPSLPESAERSAAGGSAAGPVVVVKYDVDENGSVDNPRLVKSVSDRAKNDRILDHVKAMMFRPRFADGEPARAADNVFEVHFPYGDEESSERQATASRRDIADRFAETAGPISQ